MQNDASDWIANQPVASVLIWKSAAGGLGWCGRRWRSDQPTLGSKPPRRLVLTSTFSRAL